MGSLREGMLRPELGDWYPGLVAGRWYPARELAELVLEQRRSGAPTWEWEERVPSDRHFVFRGGTGEPRAANRTRRNDPLSNSA